MAEYKNSYRRGYLTDCRVNQGHLELLIGIPYPNQKWFSYIEQRSSAIDVVFKEMGIHVTRNSLIDRNNLQIYLNSHDYTVIRLSKKIGDDRNTYYLKYVGHESIKGYPLIPDSVTWEPKKIEQVSISREDALNFLSKSKISKLLTKVQKFEKFSDIPPGFTLLGICYDEEEKKQYKDIMIAAFGTTRLMVNEMYIRNCFDISEKFFEGYRDAIRAEKLKENPVKNEDNFGITINF